MNILNKIKDVRSSWKEVKQERYIFMNQTENRRLSMKYAQMYKTKKINEKAVLYESYWGRGMIDNPYALFVELYGRDEFKDFTHIWVLDDFENNQAVLDQYQNDKRVRFVLFGSDEYVEALASCKYLINNVTFPQYFIKREGQIYINTWHGTPLKSMGYDMVEGNSGSANTVRNFLHADYLLSANEVMTKMYLKSYKLEGILPGKVIEEGYPRNDFLLNTKSEEEIGLLRSYGISVEDDKLLDIYNALRPNRSSKQELLDIAKDLEDNYKATINAALVRNAAEVYEKRDILRRD